MLGPILILDGDHLPWFAARIVQIDVYEAITEHGVSPALSSLYNVHPLQVFQCQ